MGEQVSKATHAALPACGATNSRSGGRSAMLATRTGMQVAGLRLRWTNSQQLHRYGASASLMSRSPGMPELDQHHAHSSRQRRSDQEWSCWTWATTCHRQPPARTLTCTRSPLRTTMCMRSCERQRSWSGIHSTCMERPSVVGGSVEFRFGTGHRGLWS